KKKGTMVTALIIGGGEAESSLKKLVAELQISDQVRWCGTVDHKVVFQLQQASDIAVIPSWIEGFSLAAAEAMAVGVPVIASSTGGLPEVIHHGHTGLLTPPGDAEALADAIQLLSENREMRIAYGNEGRKRVASLFSIEKYQTSIRHVYDQL
ncbi:MAG: glycosyltransferase, partial [Ignavibacteriales bacterium]|nr:glycosyltransferase [Ignavibacteriales bacterium]